MVKSNLAAWTPDEKNPPFISINYVDSNGTVEITVRERGDGNSLGHYVRVVLTQDEFSGLIGELFNSMIAMHGDKPLSASDNEIKRQMETIICK